MSLSKILLAAALSLLPPFTAASPRYEVPTQVPQVVQVENFCTGFVAAPGVIFTAAHCVADAVQEGQTQLEVRYPDGFRTHATILGYGDEDSRDWAVLAADTRGLQPLKIAQRPPVAGTVCAVVGHGGGSPVQRATPCQVIGPDMGYLALSATVIGGDSGGPVLDAETGEVFGITVRSRYPVPVALAVDVQRAARAAQELLRARHLLQQP